MRVRNFRILSFITLALLLAACSNAAPAESPEPVAAPGQTNAPTALVLTPTVQPSPTGQLAPEADPTGAPTLAPELPTPAPAPTPTPPSPYKDFGVAPEIDTQVWLNTGEPLRLSELRGKVVLVDFWTYG